MKPIFQIGGLSIRELYEYLIKFDNQFYSRLSLKVNIYNYSEKLIHKSIIIQSKINNEIIGLVAFYANDNSFSCAYISLFCVLKGFEGYGIGTRLMNDCITFVKDRKFKEIKLEVDPENHNAISFYSKFGFQIEERNLHKSYLLKRL